MAAFLLWALPPAQLRTGDGHDGDNQHDDGRFSHLSPRRGVTTKEKPA